MRVPSSSVELRGITKRFPGVIACDRVDLQVYPGEIHALLGENGAGKTTLMHMLYGLHHPDAGEIWIDGERMVMRLPKDAIRVGIGMVFQHFTLIPSLTVAENIALAATHSHVFMRRKPLTTRVQELAARYQLAVDPNSPVWQLSVGEQQRVEILKLLHRRARLLILDEPSAVLTPQESEALLLGVGLVPRASVLDNLLLKAYRLPPLARGAFLNYAHATHEARMLLSEFSVSAPRLDAPVSVLSGGNQQRLLLGREFSLRPTLLVACDPTRGLDVGAVETIHRLLLEQRQRGCAILLISEDLDELIALANRIAVIYEGEVAGCFRVEETDAATLGLMMAGGHALASPPLAESRA